MDGEKKNSYKALTINDIRTQARDWTLAGDVGLLAHLEQFSENICEKTQQTQKYFNELLENYEEVHTKVSNITNQFLALQNCQFVENRVYDEETPTEEKTETKVTNEVDQEKLLLGHYKEAVEIGVKLLDTHFQEVQLPLNSDSDEDDDEESIRNPTFVWTPKNPYAGKKFPLLIGSAEWWADDNIGLRDYEENLEVEKISESESEESSPSMEKKIQESSSLSMNNEKPIRERSSFLKSSSDDLFGLDKNDNFSTEGIDIFGKGMNPSPGIPKNFSPPYEEEIKKENESNHLVNDEQVSEEIQVPQDEALSKADKKMDNAFTKELAAKLVSMNSKNEGSKSILGNLQAEKPTGKSYSENLFDDDNDDSNDLFFGNVNNLPTRNKNSYFDGDNDDELFHKSNNLFFDSGANIIFENDKLPSPKTQKPHKEDNQDKNLNSQQKNPQLGKKDLVNDLFDDIDDEDTLFGSKALVQQQATNSSITDGFKKTNSGESSSFVRAEDRKKAKGLFDEVNDEFKEGLAKKSSLFDNKINDDLDFKKDILEDSVNKNVKSLFDGASRISPRESLVSNVRGKEDLGESEEKSLFEPNADLPKTGLAKAEDTSKLPSVADFGEKKSKNEVTTEEVEDLFSESFKDNVVPEKVSTSNKNVYFLDEGDRSLFLDKPKQQDSLSISSSRSSLFDDVSVSKSKLASVFEKDKTNKIEDDLFGVSDNSLFGDETLTKKEGNNIFSSKSKDKGKKSLFDDCDDMDDLFGLGNTEGDVFSEKLTFENSKDNVQDKMPNLFDKEKKKETFFEEIENSGEFCNEISTMKRETLPNNELGGDESLFEDSKESAQTKVLNMEENFFTNFDEADKVVKAANEKKTTLADNAKLWEDTSDLFADTNFLPSKSCSEPKMVVDDIDDRELFSEEKRISNETSAGKPKPPSSLNLKKDIVPETTTETKRIGKLNIPNNLKSKLESLGKIASEGQITKQEGDKTGDVEHSFEPSSSLLKCPSKDRVKIPGRRRPQSRRARQEAIRNSGANFGGDFEVGTSETENPKPIRTSSCVNVSQKKDSMSVKESPEHLFYSPSVSNPLSPSTDEEDFFNVPGLDTNFEKEDQSIFKGSLFHSTNTVQMEDNFLFDGAPVLSPVESIPSVTKAEDSTADLLFVSCQDLPDIKKGNIFEDDDDIEADDDDSLFKTGEFAKDQERKREDSSLFQISPKSKNFGNEEARKKHLFDNIADDEDDLFGENFKSMSSTERNEKVHKKNNENSQSKGKTNSSFVDPLGLMSNDE